MSDANGKCRSCGLPIYWATMPSGKPNPINRDPAPNGNLVLTQSKSSGTIRAEMYREPEHVGRNRYVSHFSTCRQAGNWRRP